MIKEEIKNINSSNSELRKFGITVGGVLVIVGMILLYFDKASYPYFIGIGGVLILFGLIFPKALLPIQKFWMALAVVLGFIMTRVILSILFYLVITPIGLIAKLFRKDFLDRKFEKKKDTYWNFRTLKDYEKIDTERQF
jgi:membrane-bound ClpP family serine protease